MVLLDRFYGFGIAFQSKSHNAFHAGLACKGMTAVRLTFCDVGDVDLNDRDADGADAIGQGDGGMGIASRVHHHGVELPIGILQFVDQHAFMVGLEIGDFVLGETFAELWQIVFEGDIAIDFGLALAEEVEVGAVEDEDSHSIVALVCYVHVPRFGLVAHGTGFVLLFKDISDDFGMEHLIDKLAGS